MSKQKLIALMVKNYYSQVEIVGQTDVTLEAYLRGIMFGVRAEDNETVWTESDLAYGLSLARIEA